MQTVKGINLQFYGLYTAKWSLVLTLNQEHWAQNMDQWKKKYKNSILRTFMICILWSDHRWETNVKEYIV